MYGIGSSESGGRNGRITLLSKPNHKLLARAQSDQRKNFKVNYAYHKKTSRDKAHLFPTLSLAGLITSLTK